MASGPFSYRDIQGTGPAWAINKGLQEVLRLRKVTELSKHRAVKKWIGLEED